MTPDETFTVLRNERRRAVLRQLRAEPETTVIDLSEAVAAAEAGTTVDQLSSLIRRRVYISLYQTHLPALAEAGVVEYDRARGEVRRCPAADELDRHLDWFDRDGADATAGSRRYAGIATGAAVVAGAVGLPPFDALDPVWWAATGVVALSVLAATTARGSVRPWR